MLRILSLVLFIFFSNVSLAQSTHVLFQTSLGEFEVELFDNTPKHRDMFIKAVKDSVYHKVLFNRVIKNFVIQGGELDDLILEEEKNGKRVKKRLPHEIRKEHIHRNGAFGAGRDDNPEKASFFGQLYFVYGKVYTEAELDAIEKRRNITISPERRKVYTKEGGVPHLDNNYTLFGQVVKGMDIIKKINQVPTSSDDVPLVPVYFSVKIIK